MKRCLGAAFSMRELVTVLHVLLREGEFSAVDDRPERIVRRSIMLAPRHGTRVRFRPRLQESFENLPSAGSDAHR
ncbi:putative cytochrome P450 [Mycobacterium kansasii]|uniref:Putative cytochrome P450 n=1 Tax=Mycobacterium kansasii TaxID=1768 RepID=A0A1V3XAR7_MYCKA|nr:putative cytochrome P450 [Mycobacterium kansasii]